MFYIPARHRRVGPCQGQHDPRFYAQDVCLRSSNWEERVHRNRRRRMDAAVGPWVKPAVGHHLGPRYQRIGIRVCSVCCVLDRLPVFYQCRTWSSDGDCWWSCQCLYRSMHHRIPRCWYKTAIALLAYHHQDEVRRCSKANFQRAYMTDISHWARFLKIRNVGYFFLYAFYYRAIKLVGFKTLLYTYL